MPSGRRASLGRGDDRAAVAGAEVDDDSPAASPWPCRASSRPLWQLLLFS